MTTATAQANPNIAFIKYWGNRDNVLRLPMNGFISMNLNGLFTRMYERFSDLSWDTVDVRIYQGIHFRFPDEDGRRQGRRVAKWAFKHFLRPVQ